MSGGRPPRRIKYYPTADTMAIALGQVVKPPQGDVDEILQALHAAHAALRQGVATEMQWSIMAGSLELARSVHRMGVVRDISGHLAEANDALQAIHDRAMASGCWRAPALWFVEMEALDVFIQLHAYQARELSRSEFLRAIELASKSIVKAGHNLVISQDVPAQFQGAGA